MKSNKIVGILLLLIFVCVSTALLNKNFISPYNLQNLLRSSSMFAIIGIGAVMVIVTGGIDLSTGSLIGLVGCTMTLTLKSWVDYPPAENGSFLFKWVGVELIVVSGGWLAWEYFVRKQSPWGDRPGLKISLLAVGVLVGGLGFWVANQTVGGWLTVAVALVFALLLSVHLGLLHGVLITKLHLQPFIVTLCGLMCYRGLTRWLTGDLTQGFGTTYDHSLRLLAIGKPCTATSVMLVAAIGLMLYGAWRSCSAYRTEERQQRFVIGASQLAMGLVLAVACSSRYWDGWTVQYGETIATWGAIDFRLFSLEIPESAVERPAQLMSYAIYPMLALFGALFLLALKATTGKNKTDSDSAQTIGVLVPLILVIGAVTSLYFLVEWIGDEPVILQKLDSETLVGKAREFVGSTVTHQMAGVFLAMAVLTGAVIWIGKTWVRNTGLAGRLLWVATGFFTVMWLLGNTSINETIVQPPFFVLVVVGGLAAVFLNKTVAGRYLRALGNNEEAAKYSGINIDRMKILAYVLCALCGGIGSILFTLNANSVEPSGHGSFYELYAIAAAVLGGCSLRGGQGSILGVIIGASIMRILYNAPDMIGIASQLEMFTIGIVILIGVIVDESSRRIAANQSRQIRG